MIEGGTVESSKPLQSPTVLIADYLAALRVGREGWENSAYRLLAKLNEAGWHLALNESQSGRSDG